MNWRSVTASFRNAAALALAGVAFVCVVRAQDSEPSASKDHPLLEVDLHKFGYDTSRGTKRLRKFVDFTDSNHLALAWVTLDDPTLADKTGSATARPAHLHVLVLDATTGEKVGVQAWSTPSTPVRFLATRDGKFLTCTGNVLRLFSPSLELVRKQDLPNDRACLNPSRNARWGISPSRRSLLLSFATEQGYQNTLLDAETFAVVSSWSEKPLIGNISDHWLLSSCGQEREACLRGIDKPWQRFQPAGTNRQMNQSRILFINDGTLMIEAWNRLTVVTVDAAGLFQVELSKNRSFGEAAVSSGGEKFAVIENKQRGLTNQALDMYAFASNDRAVVYSIADRRAIYAVRVKGTSPWTPWENHVNQLALSPDGTLLAVIDDGNLKIYRLADDSPA
jgi:outer membrane protein assembly factor BamB